MTPKPVPLDIPIRVGFGQAVATRDGHVVYDGEAPGIEEPLTIRDIEQIARRDPDHDWRVVLFAPLSGETFQRQGDHLWVSIDQNKGFA